MLQSSSQNANMSNYLSATSTEFEGAFHELIKDEVVKIIRSEKTWSVGSILEEDQVKSLIGNIFQWLLDGDLEESLAALEKLNSPSQICGRVFKPGEPTYSCRDCAMDPTCVLCQACFWNSEHSKHRYRMSASGGGGCCDCGDGEAWNDFPACSNHKSDANDSVSEQKQLNLPSAIQSKAPYFFEAILRYVVEHITKTRINLTDLPDSLRPTVDVKSFSTVLFNDESHTFDFVIHVLRDALKCTESEAADFATVVDREGRSIICIGDEEKCENAKRIVTSRPTALLRTVLRTQDPLKTIVMHITNLAHQELAVQLLPALSDLVMRSEGLREIFCSVAMSQNISRQSEDGVQYSSSIELLMKCDHELWKTPRNHYLQVIMNSILLNADAKKSFAVLFTKLYGAIQDGFLKGDHDHTQSVAVLSVQLYTVPSISRYLIEHENVIGRILHSLTKTFYVIPNAGLDPDWCRAIKIDREKLRHTIRRMAYTYHDLRYIFAVTPTDWTPDLKRAFSNGLKYVLQLLLSIHGMDRMIRRTDAHIEHEPDWETSITLMMRIYPIIKRSLRWISSDTGLLFEALRFCLECLKNRQESEHTSFLKISHGGEKYQCIDYDLSSRAVSSHYPIPRLIAAILVELGKKGFDWHDIKSNSSVAALVEHPLLGLELQEYSLRSLSLNAQVNSGMWKRNGLSLVNQLVFYKDHRCRQEAYERDIQMMQFCASVMDPDYFLVNLQYKMNFLNHTCSQEQYAKLICEVFTILIAAVGERYVPGVSDVTESESIERQIVHILAMETKPRSKIMKLLPDNITDQVDLEPVLRKVADFHEPSNANSIGKYSLKADVLNEFCPYAYQYSFAEESKAQQTMIKRKSSQNSPTFFIPPKLPEFSKLFSKTPFILCSDTFISLMSGFLQKVIRGDTEMCHDKIVHRGLYLIAMAVVESKHHMLNQSSKFDFLAKCISGCEASILFLLQKLETMDAHASHRDFVAWMIAEIERMTNLKRGSRDQGSSVDHPSYPKAEARGESSGQNARKRKAQALRSKLLLQMKTMQQNFLSQNPDLLGENLSTPEETLSIPQTTQNRTCMDASAQEQAANRPEESQTCMLCQEDSASSDGAMVMAAFVQRSSVLRKGPYVERRELSHPFLHLTFPDGIHTSTCSHAMHYKCFKQFRKSSSDSRLFRHRHRGFSEPPNTEFVCPLCSRLSNTVIPFMCRSLVYQKRSQPGEDQENNITSMVVTDEESPTLNDWLKYVCSGEEKFFDSSSEVMPDDETESVSGDPEEFMSVDGSPTSSNRCADQSENVRDSFDEFIHDILKESSLDDLPSRQLALWLSAVTTLSCTENALRLESSSVLSKLPVRQSAALEGVLGSVYALKSMRAQNDDTFDKLFNCVSGDATLPALLDCNVLAVFCYLWFSAAAKRDGTGLADVISFERNILRLCALAQLVQIFVRLKVSDLELTRDSAGGLSAVENLVENCNTIRAIAGLSRLSENVSRVGFVELVTTCMLPFLRCCGLFLTHLTGVAPCVTAADTDEFTALMKYLDLPERLSAILDFDDGLQVARRWLSHPDLRSSLSSSDVLSYPELSRTPDLMPLPHNYGALVGAAAAFKCPKFASDDSLHPTMCLVCGAVLCSQSYCCQQPHPDEDENRLVGACTYHAMTCGAGRGLFLRVRECTVVLLDKHYRGTFITAPYLDRHGETDKGLRRGDPLYLDDSRLCALRKMWLSHGIPERVCYDTELKNIRYMLDWAHL